MTERLASSGVLCAHCSCKHFKRVPESVCAVHLHRHCSAKCIRPSILCIDKCAYTIRFLLLVYQLQMSERKRGLCPAVMYRFLMPIWRVFCAACIEACVCVMRWAEYSSLAQSKLIHKTIFIRLFIYLILSFVRCVRAWFIFIFFKYVHNIRQRATSHE